MSATTIETYEQIGRERARDLPPITEQQVLEAARILAAQDNPTT